MSRKLQERAGQKGFASTIMGGALGPQGNATPGKMVTGY